MAITKEQKDKIAKLIDGLNLGTHHAKAGQAIMELIDEAGAGGKKGVAVADAAAAPTKAEFDALLASLRGAGLIATA